MLSVATALGTRAVPVIINPSAGWLRGASLRSRSAQLVRAFQQSGLDAQLRVVGPDTLARAVYEARVRGNLAVFVGGGDGTISTAASVLAGTPTALGVLPMGTRNHFAADLGLPRDVAGTVRALCAGQVTQVDVAEVNGRVFVNNLSLGLYPSAVVDVTRHHQHLGVPKGVAFGFAMLGALWRLPRVRVHIRAPGTLDDHSGCDAPFVIIGNNEYAFEGGRFGRRGALDRGELSVYWAPNAGRMGAAIAGVRAVLRRFDPVSRLLVPFVELSTPRRTLDVALDGELHRMRSPLRVRCRPGALRVVLPAPTPAEDDPGE